MSVEKMKLRLCCLIALCAVVWWGFDKRRSVESVFLLGNRALPGVEINHISARPWLRLGHGMGVIGGEDFYVIHRDGKKLLRLDECETPLTIRARGDDGIFLTTEMISGAFVSYEINDRRVIRSTSPHFEETKVLEYVPNIDVDGLGLKYRREIREGAGDTDLDIFRIIDHMETGKISDSVTRDFVRKCFAKYGGLRGEIESLAAGD